MAETAIVSFHTLLVGFPLPTISKNSLNTLFCSLILDHGVLLIISISGPVILISNFLLDTSLHQSFQSVRIRSYFSFGKSPYCTVPIRSGVSQTLVFLIWTILPRCHQMGFSSEMIIFRPTLNRIPEYLHFKEQ